ncbi:MAG: hypothetical protein ACLQU3_00765 [Limisphaerales bacterium]
MRRASIWILLGSLAVLLGLSVDLAITRIYQVDECMELVVTRILATGQAKTYSGSIGLLLLPLSWAVHGATRSVEYFISARLVMVVIFWLNLVLIAIATGERLFSRRGLVALLGAATLAPLWDYGFEVRHDNLLLTGLLLIWCVVRVRPKGPSSYLVAGALAVALQFTAYKAFVYVIPLSLAVLLFPPPGHQAPRWKLALCWIVGALGMLTALRLVYGAYATGSLDANRTNLQFVSKVAAGGNRFGPGLALGRLPGQTPLLLTLVASGLVALAMELRRRGRSALAWDGILPEALLLAVAFAALLVNPTPFPYNLLHLVPFAFLFAFRHASAFFKEVRDNPALLPVAGAVLVFVHLAPFCVATQRHWNWPNSRQTCLMRLAEDLTDRTTDPVFDGVGMVLTRPLVDPRLLLHSLYSESMLKGIGPQVRDFLAARPAAVFIPNYRTDWLPAADHDAIREMYVAVADDFWVLGKVLPAGGGTFQIFHAGRYRISSLQSSDLAAEGSDSSGRKAAPSDEANFTATLDGAPVSSRPAELTVGEHRIECKPGCQPAVVWVGPKLDRVGRLSQSDHRRLFFNWY